MTSFEYKKKQWGAKEFWGLSSDFDPDWILTKEQDKLRTDLIELCRIQIRPHAIHCDLTYEFPRKSLNSLASLGLLGLIVPKELGGLGESHTCAAMIVETIARYGCPSTALIYTMHLGAVAPLCLSYHNSARITDLLKRLNKDKLLGTLSYSDPATGGHLWYHLSSKVQKLDDDTLKVLKYGSWATGAGMVDWYTIQTVSPAFDGDYANVTCFLAYADEIRASTEDWRALGMHGNQSGPLIVEGNFKMDRLIGAIGDGLRMDDEVADFFFLILTGSVYNGVSLACMDLAKKHVTRKVHGDVGMRICDYASVQDHFGECLSSTTISRSYIFMITQLLDKVTNNCDWSKHEDLDYLPRTPHLHWTWIAKHASAKNVTHVADTMLHCCGGTGYKTDLGIERLLRDAKAGWVMGQSNEVLTQYLGKSSLMGMDVLDHWGHQCNDRIVNSELKKMSLDKKKELAQSLMEEVKQAESGESPNHPYQDTDFENPFNTCEPEYSEQNGPHKAALSPSKWTTVKLIQKDTVGKRMESFVFALPDAHTVSGCLPGQYVQVRITIDGKGHERYFSPVSTPEQLGKIELVLRYETQGIVSNFFERMTLGDHLELLGPCGGFEYKANQLDELTLLAAGAGITPGMQLIRSIVKSKTDKTHVTAVYYCDSVNDILYHDELSKYNEDKRLDMVFSLGETPENWEGEEGFIDAELISKYIHLPNGLKNKIVICGGPTMAISCLHALRHLGFKSEDIFVYGQFGSEQMRAVFGRKTKLANHQCIPASQQ